MDTSNGVKLPKQKNTKKEFEFATEYLSCSSGYSVCKFSMKVSKISPTQVGPPNNAAVVCPDCGKRLIKSYAWICTREILDDPEKLARSNRECRAFIDRANSKIRLERLEVARKSGIHTKVEWLAIVKEFDYRCVQCGCVPVKGVCKDHIIPLVQGGSDAIENLQPLCRKCNSYKNGYTACSTEWPDGIASWIQYRRKYGWPEDAK